MKEDKDLLKKYGKKNPFTVPEGYFQDFSEKLMEQLPEKEVMPEPEIRMWDRIKPWVYMAAMFVGLMFTVRAFVGEQPSSQSTDMEIGNYTEIPDEYLDPIVNQTMMDEGVPLVQLEMAGYDRPYARHGNKYVVTAPGCFLLYESMEDT